MSILDDLERLEQAATAGPWEVADAGLYLHGKYELDEYFVRRPEDDTAIAEGIIDPDTSKPSRENAALISAARNALPALLALARACQAEEAALQARVRATTQEERHETSEALHQAANRRRDALAALEAHP